MVQTTATSSSVRGHMGQIGGQLLQELEALNQALYQAGQCKSDDGVPLSSKLLTRGETLPSRLESELSTHSETLDPLGVLLRSSHPRPPVSAKGSAAPSLDTGRKVETPCVEHGQERHVSPGFEKDRYEVTNFLESVDGNVDFGQRLEAPAEKKKGLWGWKPFRALAHVGQQRFNCLFTVHVHGIEGLPASVNGLRLGVHFAKKDDTGVQTMPSRVFQGYAEFQETLHTRCSLHGAKNGAKGMKWESKQFTLSVIAIDIDELVVGRHVLELTRLLPDTIEDDYEKQDAWTTSFKLTGKAEGATLIVTFGCEIQSKYLQTICATSSSRFGESPVLRAVRSFNSLATSGHATPSRCVSEAHHSPALSEPSAEYHSIEHLCLDDFNHEGPYITVRGSMQFDPQSATMEDAKFLSGVRTPVLVEKAPFEAAEKNCNEVLNENVHASGSGEEVEEEEELQFTVVDQGVEVGAILDNIFGRGYDAFESENTSEFQEKEGAENVVVSTEAVFFCADVSQEVENQYEGNEKEDEKEVSTRGAAGDNLNEADELKVQGSDRKDSGTRSVNTFDIKHVSSSIDEELEMQELLAALVEQERESEGEEDADNPNDPKFFQGTHVRGGASTVSNITIDQGTEKRALYPPDYMTEEELFSLLPAGSHAKRVLESDDEFDFVAGEFLCFLESKARPIPVAVTSDSEPDSPRALLLKQLEKEAIIESGLGLNMKMPELLSSVESEVPDFCLDGIFRDGGIDSRPTSEAHDLPMHQHIISEDFKNLGWDREEDVELDSIMEAAELELQKATQTMRSKTRAKMLEDAETEALMQEWGFNKESFETTSPKSLYADDAGNPFPMVAFDAPPLGIGLGSMVPVRDGGSLRSMNPFNVQSSSGGQLVMQVSKPVVVPTDMGANSLDILLRMAAAGMDGMTNQAMMTMPLDDITGKSVEQIATEGFAAFRGNYHGREHCGYTPTEGGHAPFSLEYTQDSYLSLGALTARSGSGLVTTLSGGTDMRKINPNIGDESFMSLEDLAPMAMHKIESLALEGLKIQSDMAEEEAPFAVEPFSGQEGLPIDRVCSARQRGGKSEINSLEEISSMPFLDGGRAEGSGISDDSFLMAISLDEWMRLDAGVVDENDISGNTLALVATHHASHGDIESSKENSSNSGKQDEKLKDGTNEEVGVMGSTITLAMLVQLRDPLRNFEPIGAPMMALVQAERVVVPPMPKLRFRKQISLKGSNECYDDGSDVPFQRQFKITDVTLSGLKIGDETTSDKKKQTGWGTQKQQQSGSRWLVASGMAKTTKHPILKPNSNAIALPATNKSTSSTSKADSLWSITTKIGSRWGVQSVPKIRNPDVVMSKTGWFGRKK